MNASSQQAHRHREHVLSLVRRLPFTVTIILTMFVTAVVTDTLSHPISPSMLARWGFDVDNLRSGYLLPILLSPFQVLRPYMALSIAATLLLFVGACEYRLGTRRTLVVFWLGHIGGMVLATLLLWGLGELGFSWAQRLALQKDVGASNGAMAAAGAVVVFLPDRFRSGSYLLILSYLLLALGFGSKVWDFQHLIAFHIGLGIGGLFLRRTTRDWAGVFPRLLPDRRQYAAIIVWIVGITGIVNILSAFLIPHHEGFARLESWVPLGSVHWPRHTMLVLGVVMLYQARGLARRQRNAWRVTMVLLLASFALHWHVGITKTGAILSAVCLVGMTIWRRQYVVRSDLDAARAGYTKLLATSLFVPLYGIVGFFLLRSQFQEPVGWASGIHAFVSQLFFPSTSALEPLSRPAEWFIDSIPLVVYGWILYAVIQLLKPSRGLTTPASDREFARYLLFEYGSSGTAYMTLREGNSLYFGPARASYVAYRVNSNIALILGDPIGPNDLFVPTINGFSEYAREQGWDHVFYAVTSSYLTGYKEAGYNALQIGEEAVIPLEILEFKGKEWQSIRSAMNRAERTGVVFRMYEGGKIPPDVREQLVSINDEWLKQRGLPPMEFTLGNIDDIDDPNITVSVAVDNSGHVHAYADWLPVYTRRGWVIDLMRRRGDAMHGAMEFVIGMSLMTFKARGYKKASLATAPLADIDREKDSSLVPWILGQVYNRFETYYHFRSLFEFKGKFQPTWEPIFLIYRSAGQLPRIALSVLKGHLPGLDAIMVAKLLGSAAAEHLFAEKSETPSANQGANE